MSNPSNPNNPNNSFRNNNRQSFGRPNGRPNGGGGNYRQGEGGRPRSYHQASYQSQGGGRGPGGPQSRSQQQNQGPSLLSNQQTRPPQPVQAGNLRILPVGGQGELGRSCWIFETVEEILIIDAGIGFVPHGTKGGIDLLLPNLNYLIENKEKIKGLVISNAHEEYSGDLIDFIEQLELKEIYVPKIIAELNKNEIPAEVKVTGLEGQKTYQIGKDFKVSPFRVSFSTSESYALLVDSLQKKVFYTGAFKIDHTPAIKDCRFDVSEIARQVSETGVDLLIANSTNVETQGYTLSETTVTKKLNDVMNGAKGRIITIISSSHTQKLEILLGLAQKNKKKVCLVGEEILDWYWAAKGVGLLNYPDDLFVTVDDLKAAKLASSEIIIITGALEGDILEPFINLAYKRHQEVSLIEGDTIVVSSNPPLGTSRLLANAVDQLFIQGVSVIGGRDAGVYVSGYASQEELKFMYNLTRPKYFLPSHGEARQLVLHAELLGKCGMNPQNVIIVDNGCTVDIDPSGKAAISGKVPAEAVLFNKSLDSELNQQSLEERRNLGEDGTIITVMTLNFDQSKLVAGPTLKIVGSSFDTNKNWPEIQTNIVNDIRFAVDKALKAGQKETGVIRHLTHDVLSKRIREKFGMSKPVFSIVIQEVH